VGAQATGFASHAEGRLTTASGTRSHAEGESTIASGDYAHAEGGKTEASGNHSHSEGCGTIAASNMQHVQGKYNIFDPYNKYAHIVGNGAYGTPSNAHTLDWDGNAWFAGGIELTSPNGTRYRFTVSDDGTLTAKVVTV
jgi:1,4-alpha-glucan branching enzyme